MTSPLSFAQQRLWFLDQFSPASALYNIPIVLDLDGPLHIEALRGAIEEIVRRHAALRTVFPARDGIPVQEVRDPHVFPLPLVDFSSLPDSTRDGELAAFVTSESRRPFDLATGPLFRAALVRLAAQHHVLVSAVHHIVWDAWSSGVFYRELTALYRAYAAGESSPLPALPAQYVDFSRWQRDRAQGDSVQRQLTYWKQHLSNLPRLELPTDLPRPGVQTYAGRRDHLLLPTELVSAVDAFSRSQGATPFVTLLSAYATLLHRYTGQEDLVIGTPITNRTRQEFEPLIGFFLNTLALRLDLTREPTFRELVQRVKRVAFTAYGNQDLPFEKLVEELQPERSLSHDPIVETAFVFDNSPGATRDTVRIGDLTLRRRVIHTETSKFDLALMLFKREAGYRASLECSSHLFNGETSTRLLACYRQLLAAIVADPDQRIGRLPLLDTAERTRVTAGWNVRSWPYPRTQTVSQLFEEQAARTPDAEALVDADQRATYADLNGRANRLAHYLIARGVRVEDRVGVCLERSAETIVAMLAILKAGAAYVPLDPSYPRERLQLLIEQTEARLVISRNSVAVAPAHEATMLVALDAEADGIATYPAHDPPCRTSADALAYVLFTSGSTGDPKAVGVPHRAIARLVHGMPDVPFGTGERMLQLAPLAFDVTTLEIWAPLTHGGCVVVAPGGLPTPDELESWLAGERITLLWLTASLFNVIIDQRAAALRSVRYLLIGGEALSVPHVERALQALPNTVIINGYGPTETTTFATYHIIPRATSSARQTSVPIGYPVGNTRLYVLDKYLEPTPVGFPGELWIGGDALARGYLNDPELTAHRFVRDPFVQDVDARMYRSGDRARFLPDGTVEFLGRLDDQVKIRGFRIEPGEIEASLIRHPSVSGAAVAVQDVPSIGRSLVAFVVGRTTAVPPAADLRAFLKTRLPDHMVPGIFVPLEALPLLPSGKIDRRALPKAEPAGPQSIQDRRVHEWTPTEAAVAAVWRDILRTRHLSPQSDFFELGGHSLLATQVVSRLSATFQMAIDVRSIFETPTVAGLAAAIDARRGPPVFATSIPQAARNGHLPLSFAQQRLWFLHQWNPTTGVYNVPVAFRLRGPLDAAALERAINRLIARHEALRTVFDDEDGQPSQRVLEDMTIRLAVRDLRELPQVEAERVLETSARGERTRPFDLARGPLIRGVLLRVGASEHVLLITLHHIVADGWSLGVLFLELEAIYSAETTGVEAALPPLPIQYADFTIWQRTRSDSNEWREQLEYWRSVLRPPRPVLELPLDKRRPINLGVDGGRVERIVPAEIADAAEAFARRENATPFMVLLAAFLALLHRYSGQEDILVGTPIAGRTHAEIEPLVGFFVNTLVLRGDLSGDPTFRQLVARVKQRALDAYANQDLPFERLIEQLQPERTTSHAPLFQVMFVLQNASPGQLRLPGVVVEPIRVAAEFAKFDLTLAATRTPNGYRASFEYNTDLFVQKTIERLAAHYETLLARALADIDKPLAELPLADDVRRDLFERQMAATPDATPVSVLAPSPSRATSQTGCGEIEGPLLEIWRSVLGIPDVSPDASFFDLGGHSLLAVRLFAEVEKRLGVKLPLATLFHNGTLREQARLIASADHRGGWSPVVALQPDGSRPPFFLVHGIGGEVLGFAPLAQRLGRDQPVYGLQARLDEGARFFSSIEDMAATYVRAMRRVAPSGPYRIGGYSAGGLIAYEMAQQLHADGERVALLAMIDCAAPDGARSGGSKVRMAVDSLRNAAFWMVDDDFFRAGARAAAQRVKSKAIVWGDRIRARLDGRAPQVDVRHALGLWAYPDNAVEFLEAHARALKSYRPAPYDGAISVIRSRTHRLGIVLPLDLGWQTFAKRGVTVRVIAGAHDNLVVEPRVRILANTLETYLSGTGPESA